MKESIFGKSIIFGDPGIDDSFAIMYGLLHPEIEIVGIVTGYGNVEHIHAAHNAAYILQLANRQNIPVISGATKPLTEEITTYYPEIHGAEGLGPSMFQKIYYLFQYIISAVLLRFL